MKAVNYIKEWFFNPARRSDQITSPTALNFPITDNCNSRCVMCNVWEEKVKNELTPKEIAKYFCSPALSNLRHVGISGGEPTLRKDLVECVLAILSSLPKQESLSITSHGYHYRRWARFLPEIIDATKSKGVSFSLNLSLDGVGETHNQIRGIGRAFERVCKTLFIAKELGVQVQLQCTVSKGNVYHVGRVLAFAYSNSVEVIFRCATTIERLQNDSVMPNVVLSKHERSFLSDFFTSPTLNNQTNSPGRRLYYEEMSKWLIAGGERSFPCYFKNEGVLITSIGDVYSCSITDKKLGSLRQKNVGDILLSESGREIRNQVKLSDCSECIHDQTGAWAPMELIIEQLKHKGVLKHFDQIKKIANVLIDVPVGVVSRNLQEKNVNDFNRGLLIGAYGGEHVGDAAILGGVIQRLVKREKIKSIVVASFRPSRTAMWVEMLDLPITVEVIDYKEISQALKLVSHVVYAGGPLMELPAQLARHLAVLSRAKRKGCKVIIEGVGLGPLYSFHSKYLVKAILRISDDVSVRTKLSKVLDLIPVNKVIREVRDPAFDYLESRLLVNLKECSSKQEIDSLLYQSDIKVAINLRPLWDKYNFSNDLTTEEVELEYLKKLSITMSKLQKKYGRELTFYFFPMNPDQFGMSDLTTAYQLSELLEDNVRFSIWEAEPDIDSLLYFLDQMSAIVSMRFHGCIFSMKHSKNKLIGLDYQIGKAGKVGQLMDENSLASRCVRVDLFNDSQMVEMIESVVSSHLQRLAKD